MITLPYLDNTPRIGARVSAHDTSAIVGRSVIGGDCSLGELTLIRADGEDIRIGDDCWFSEASTVHIADSFLPAIVGSHVTVGRYGLVHACTIGDDCVIGEHSAVMDGSVLGPGAVIAAQSIVPPGKTLEGGWLYAGAPARPVERVTPELLAQLHDAIRNGRGAPIPHIHASPPLDPLRRAPGTGIDQRFASGVYVAPTATLRGNVVLHPRSSIWFSTEVDAGEAVIEIGEETNVQDNSRLYAGRPGEDIRIGPRVLIGHNVRIFSCLVEEGAIIGMGSTVGPGTIIRAGGCLAAGSITEPGTEVAAGQVWSGRPARAARPLSDANREGFARGVQGYVKYAANYLAAMAKLREVTA